MTDVGSELRRFPTYESRIHADVLAERGINREEQVIEERIAGTTGIEIAILEVAAQFASYFKAVSSMSNRERIIVVVDVFPGARGLTHERN